MKKTQGLILLTGCITGMAASVAVAQDAPNSSAAKGDSPPPLVVITGTHISRPNATAATPIQSVTASEIKAQAAVNVEEILNRLPQIAPDSQQNYQDSDGRQRIKLRNLGFERTLTLVDGKRLGTQNGQDANMIPAALLERVDVLTGGASSTYGSDAVAGVVNFIMKRKFEGVQVDANHNFYLHKNSSNIATDAATSSGFAVPTGTHMDGRRSDLSVAAGTQLWGDRLHVAGFANYRQADLLPYGNRDVAACQLLQSGKDGPLSCSTSTYSPSGFISPASGSNAGARYVNNPDGSRSFVPFGTGPGKAANPFDGYSFQRKNERWNAGSFLSLDISDSAELYADVMWFRDHSTNPFPARVFSYTAYGSDPYQVNCNNPFLSPQQGQALCGNAAGTNALVPLDVRYRFDALPDVQDLYVNGGTRLSGGVRGSVGKAWSYDVGLVYARNRQDTTFSNFPEYAKVNQALNVVNVNGKPTCVATVDGSDPNCVPFDAFSANNNSAALFNNLLTGRSGTSTGIGTLKNLIGTLQGDLASYGVRSPWAKDGVMVALGAEYRHDTLNNFADAVYRDENGGTDRRLKQHVSEGNVEFQAPLVQHRPWAEQLQVNGGYRTSKYSGNPKSFGTWKLESVWAPVEAVTFRGSINKSQRAPTVVETSQALNSDYSTQGGSQNDFCASTPRQVPDPQDPTKTITVFDPPKASRAVCAATGLPAQLYGSPTLSCPDGQCTVRSGGFAVDPETAFTKTIGVVLKPGDIKGLVISLDYFRIDLDHSIGYNDDAYFWNGCLQTGSDFFCSKIVRNADGTLFSPPRDNPATGYIRQGTTNYYRSESHGVDVQVQYRLNLKELGSIDWNFAGSLTTKAGGQDSPILPSYNCPGYYGGPCGQQIPRWTHGLRTTYASPDSAFTASLNWRYVGSMTNVSNSGRPELGGGPDAERTTFYRIPGYSYFDLALSYRVSSALSLRLAANNLFDKSPPILPNSYDYGLSRSNTLPARYDSLGRQIALGASLSF